MHLILTRLLLAALVVIGVGPRPARAEQNRQRIIVHDLEPATEQLKDLARTVTDTLLADLSRRKEKLIAMGRTEIELVLSSVKDAESLKQKDCLETKTCLTELSEAAQADALINGHVGSLGGESVVITLNLIDAKRAIATRSTCIVVDDPRQLADELHKAADELLGDAPKQAPNFIYNPEKGSKVAVIALQELGTREGLGESIAQLVTVEMRKIEGLDVITKSEIRAMITFEVDKAKCLGKESLRCIIQLGEALDTDQFVATRIAKFGKSQYVLSLALIDVKTGSVLNRVSESYDGPEASLPRAVQFSTANLIGTPISGKGDLTIVTDEEGELVVDAGKAMTLPLGSPLKALPAGPHQLSIDAPGYFRYSAVAYLLPNTQNRFEPELERIPPPFWRTWWFWGAVAGVAAATTVSVILLLPPESAEGTVIAGGRP